MGVLLVRRMDVMCSSLFSSNIIFWIWDSMVLSSRGKGEVRAFCNGVWQRFAPYTSVRHLSKLKSDHRPLLVATNPEGSTGGKRPFRFLASWLQHP